MITDDEKSIHANRKRNDKGSDRTDNSKGEDEEKSFVEKVIKMRMSKNGKEEFLDEMGWIPSESGYLGTI